MSDDNKEPYKFPDRPAAKSSTSALINVPGFICCPKCGCRSLGPDRPGLIRGRKSGCVCDCHEDL